MHCQIPYEKEWPILDWNIFDL
uniref:Uncharacterized protein n=1 Tax=Arundo donax TaxID=35708 RepID=A0A0A9B764_ARUDO